MRPAICNVNRPYNVALCESRPTCHNHGLAARGYVQDYIISFYGAVDEAQSEPSHRKSGDTKFVEGETLSSRRR